MLMAPPAPGSYSAWWSAAPSSQQLPPSSSSSLWLTSSRKALLLREQLHSGPRRAGYPATPLLWHQQQLLSPWASPAFWQYQAADPGMGCSFTAVPPVSGRGQQNTLIGRASSEPGDNQVQQSDP
ncbi:uncharacterized protein LOC115836342 isoform X3 [Nomascus leucogenys]|uniref:uncharacterized protein LOC115836342 isoform X3 n=1 Tax=Nomascus leucogenys TaxID=61853 RepID=UPI00122DBA1C|nr:uncharacterized protein LOC115836342 isoform X3 [Nomascus leucogenys]